MAGYIYWGKMWACWSFDNRLHSPLANLFCFGAVAVLLIMVILVFSLNNILNTIGNCLGNDWSEYIVRDLCN